VLYRLREAFALHRAIDFRISGKVGVLSGFALALVEPQGNELAMCGVDAG
jgi:hypothetical protein